MPSQIDENLTDRQYFQQANQVMLTRQTRNFDVNHSGTDVCYGLLTGYACCTSNMHQGWPKFAQNLWYATADKGVAALVYSPSEVKLRVADNREITIKEETAYPFGETIKFTINTGKAKQVSFPFHLRIPKWCNKASIKVNGKAIQESDGNKTVKLDRQWNNGDVVELNLPMHIYKNTWFENSMSVERGPIVYALKIGEEMKKVQITDKDSVDYGNSYYEVRPTTPWNYGLIERPDKKLAEYYTVATTGKQSNYPWTLAAAPIVIKTKGKRIPSWQLYNDMTGPLPVSNSYGLDTQKAEDIILVPYGCTRLRISQFPVVGE